MCVIVFNALALRESGCSYHIGNEMRNAMKCDVGTMNYDDDVAFTCAQTVEL